MSDKKQVKLIMEVNKEDCDVITTVTSDIVNNALGYTPMSLALKGASSGVSELDDNGKVVSSQLPSFVDDVIEGYLHEGSFYKESTYITKITEETGKIYIDLSTEKTYRWSGSQYTVISDTIALGETSSTAYRGDRGKIAYDHSQSVHAPSNAEKNQNAFANVKVGEVTISADTTSDTLNVVAGNNVTITTDSDTDTMTISAKDTTYTNVTDSASGLMTPEYKVKLDGIAEGANNYTLPSAGSSLGGVKTGGDVTISSGVITVNDDSHNHVIGNVDGLQTALDGKAPTNHSHYYAGSSEVGGSAESAEKLNTDAGSATQPVYFSNGVPVATTYTLGKSVPSNAVFTDTKYTHPTTSGNKHIPSGGSSGQILRWSADGTAVWGADNNTTYTTFVKSGSGAKAGLVPAPSTTAGATKYLREDGTWTVPPNTTYSAATTSANGLMTSAMVTKLNGITDSADSVSFSRSLTSGTKVGTITINGTGTDLYAPTNTDTHYTTGLKVGASSTATANAAATNGNVYLNALDNTTVRDSHKITGSGATTVTSDANGVITISSTNTTYTSLKNPYALTIKGNGTTLTNGTYDGSAAKTVNITPSSIGAAASSHSHSYLPLSLITIQTGSTKKAKITLETLMNWLITKGYIPSDTNCYRTITTNWSYNSNDILRLTTTTAAGTIKYELQLAGVVIEFVGSATSYNSGVFRLRIHSAPTTDNFTLTSGYNRFPVSHIAEYYCNGSEYSPTWKVLSSMGDGEAYNVTQSNTTTSNYRPILMGYNNSTDTSTLTTTVTNQVMASSSIYAQPSTGTLFATTFSGALSGNASSATKWATARNINGLSVDGTANRVNYGTCSTAAATQAKIVDCAGFSLITGSEITVKFTVTNTASNPTLNVNGTGNKAIKYRGSNITAGYLAANRTYTFRYDGTNYDLVGDINTDTNTDTKVTQTNTTTSSAYRLLMSYNANDTTQTVGVRKSAKFTANPSTGVFTASGGASFGGLINSSIGSLVGEILYADNADVSLTIDNLWNYSTLLVTYHAVKSSSANTGYLFTTLLPIKYINSGKQYNVPIGFYGGVYDYVSFKKDTNTLIISSSDLDGALSSSTTMYFYSLL